MSIIILFSSSFPEIISFVNFSLLLLYVFPIVKYDLFSEFNVIYKSFAIFIPFGFISIKNIDINGLSDDRGNPVRKRRTRN